MPFSLGGSPPKSDEIGSLAMPTLYHEGLAYVLRSVAAPQHPAPNFGIVPSRCRNRARASPSNEWSGRPRARRASCWTYVPLFVKAFVGNGLGKRLRQVATAPRERGPMSKKI